MGDRDPGKAPRDSTSPLSETWIDGFGRARGAARPSPPAGESPPAIGDYRIFTRLGQGAMGDVFLAFDEKLSRNIALKRIRPELVDEPTARRRFEVEARVTAFLQHPSIVPVYHFSGEGGESFYTMRPVAGVTLAGLLRELEEDRPGSRERWPTGRLVRLFLQAANAVAYAHSRGVIHRDLKPANIMIGPFEEVLVLDWGLAKVVDDATGEVPVALAGRPLDPLHATAAYVAGTPAYMSPEQLRGEPASRQTDIFSLGIILYELLALRPPFGGESIPEILAAMQTPPEPPGRLRPGRDIPSDLARAALKAIEFDPGRRHDSVTRFSEEVAEALEGRASWRLERQSRDRESWSLSGGTITEGPDHISLYSRGQRGVFRYSCTRRFTDNLRVQFELSHTRGAHELSVWLNAAHPQEEGSAEGYQLQVLPGGLRNLSVLRSGRVVAGASSPRFEPRSWYAVTVAREGDRFSLAVGDREVYVYHDPIPLSGGFVGITGRSEGLRIRDLRIYSLGAGATVSCLSVPDAFFNRKLFEEARAEYDHIARSHPGRDEGRLAGFRSGLCLLEMARREADAEWPSMLLDEALASFSGAAADSDSCLRALGRAMVAAERGELAEEREAIGEALEGYPGDPHRSAAIEWLLGRVHAAGSGGRRALAELLPLAIGHARDDWGSRVAWDVVAAARRDWEIPSFMLTRSRFKQGERLSAAEARLFFAFWASRSELVERVVEELARDQALRPHHLFDATVSLLEMGRRERAEALLLGLDGNSWPLLGRSEDRTLVLSRAALLTARGEVDEAERLLSTAEPSPYDRAFNTVRLGLARACFEEGADGRALKVLRPLGGEDRFGREHRTWFLLRSGDADHAAKEIQPLIERDDHLSGKSLANFLQGAALVFRGRAEEARQVFACLPQAEWPRTWTLGSHYALGRLGGGDLKAWLEGAFPWEKKHLAAHAELLAQGRGEAEHPLLRELL